MHLDIGNWFAKLKFLFYNYENTLPCYVNKMSGIFRINLSLYERWQFPFSFVSDSVLPGEVFVFLQTLEVFIFSKSGGACSKGQKTPSLTSIVQTPDYF